MTSRIGDPCPRCDEGFIGVLNTRVVGTDRIRWLGCHGCGWRPEDNKQIVPLKFAPRRRVRLKFRRHSAD